FFTFFFFFQAEDGIRDKLVTGVQTCALPISGAVDAVNIAGICCVITTAGASDGNAINSSCSASTPPVDAPTAMIFSDELYDTPGRCRGRTSSPERGRIFAAAAALTLVTISSRKAGSPSTRPMTGFATQ